VPSLLVLVYGTKHFVNVGKFGSQISCCTHYTDNSDIEDNV